MKVIFLTEGGKDIGFGHITRCISLSQAFEEKKIRPVFIVNGDNAVRDFLGKRKNEVFNWLREKRLFKIIGDASMVIVDSYLAGAGIYKKISNIVKIPVYIDDNNRIDYPKGFVVNGATYARELNYPKKGGIKYLLGPRYILLRKEFWNTRKKINDKVENILITFGGEDLRNMTPKILRLVNKHYPSIHKKVVVGRGFRNKEEIEMLKDKKTELLYNLDAKRMKEAMLESDIAISAGGQTLYELAALEVPAIGICIASNQLNNLKGWHKAGFIEYGGWWNSKALFQRILECIENLQDKTVRMEKSRKAQGLVDGKGCSRVCDFLLKRN